VWRCSGLVFAASVLLIPAEAAAPAAPGGELSQVLARFDQVQRSLRTFSAEFTETTRSALLKEPIVARGRFYLTKPDSVRWEYTSPEPMRFVIADNEYTGYFPQQKRAEKRDIHRWREQLFRFLGLGQASEELAQSYDLALASPESGMSHTYLLRLTPKKKRVRKRLVDEVHLWIDKTSYLPVKVEYSSKNGSSKRLIEFDRVELNPDLSASLYTMEIPPGIPITTGFSALSGFNPDSGRP
jgi:outer membrane lipoprotein-sorting protein